MEAFSLLKYWKNGSIGSGHGNGNGNNVKQQPTVSVITAVNDCHVVVSDDEDSISDGPFFDLEFAVPDDVADDVDKEDVRLKVEEREIMYDEIEDETEEREFTTQSDDEEEAVVHVDGSDAVAEMEEIIQTALTGSKSGQFPVSLVKSATKLKVFMSGLKRSKSDSKQIPIQNNSNSRNINSKFLKVRLKMEEVLSRVKNTQEDEKSVNTDNKTVLQESNAFENNEEKRNNKKEVVEKYLKLVRPLYIKISKKNNDDTAVDAVAEKRGKRRLSLKVIGKKSLGKSKSAVVHSMSPINGNSNGNRRLLTVSKKSNDWLLQQQDGIQGAILHCKRSFNSSSSSSSEGGDETTAVLFRSASDPSYEKNSVPETETETETETEAETQEKGRNGVVA